MFTGNFNRFMLDTKSAFAVFHTKYKHIGKVEIITYIGVSMVDKHCQCRENFTNHIHWRRRILVAAQVHHDPRDVPQERQRNTWVDEGDKRLDDAEADDIIAALWTVTCAKCACQCQHSSSQILANFHCFAIWQICCYIQ